ncbi:hypothetical protein DY000_02058092 [Brassica cretica]|uniref:Uncharacterized protein n=1 Tax=Brassica cretica TaxID=69181 RepID=A0ABQ7AIU5_BRACR|nr:hypothetical protein DY000_02058092 [Brassica cretica]
MHQLHRAHLLVPLNLSSLEATQQALPPQRLLPSYEAHPLNAQCLPLRPPSPGAPQRKRKDHHRLPLPKSTVAWPKNRREGFTS